MALKEDIKNDLKEAIKRKDDKVVLVLRSFLAEVNKKEIELQKREEGLPDEEIENIVVQELKKRKEAAEQYKKGGRGDLAEDEEAEAAILEKYAPDQLSDEEIMSIVDDIIKETGASGMSDIGAVMKGVMAKVGNKADGSKVNTVVREKLQNL